jgi:hypothetical protein
LAALSLAVFSYNLNVLFQRHLGWLDRVSIGTLRFRLFSTAGIISHSQGQPTIKLAVAIQKRIAIGGPFMQLQLNRYGLVSQLTGCQIHVIIVALNTQSSATLAAPPLAQP